MRLRFPSHEVMASRREEAGFEPTYSPEVVSATVTAYRQAGVQVPVIFPLTWGAPTRRRDRRPRRHPAGRSRSGVTDPGTIVP